VSVQLKKHWPQFFSFLILLGLATLYFISEPFEELVFGLFKALKDLDQAALRELILSYGYWGPLIIILSMLLQLFALPLPSFLVMLISVLVYGPIWGVLLAILAIFLVSSLGYFLGKALSESWMKAIISEKAEEKLESILNRYGFWAVFIFRLNPLLSNDAISLVAGLLKFSYRKFILASLAGTFPLLLLIAFFEERAEEFESSLIWISLFMLGFVALYFYFDRKNITDES